MNKWLFLFWSAPKSAAADDIIIEKCKLEVGKTPKG